MASTTDKRIAARTEAARETLASKGFFGRMFGEAGLAVSNGLDRMTGWMSDERVVFAGGTAKGMARGAILGFVAAFVIAGCFSAMTPATIAMMFVGLTAGGAAAFGIYDGQTALDRHLYGQDKTLSNRIAEKSGAVKKEPAQVKSPEEIQQEQDAPSTFHRDQVNRSRAQGGTKTR